MAYAKLSTIQIAAMKSLRSSTIPADVAANVRSQLFTVYKDMFGIPAGDKLRVDLDNEGSDEYGVLIRKKTGLAYVVDDRGAWTGEYAPCVTPKRWFSIDLADGVDSSLSLLDWDDGRTDVQPVHMWTSAGHTLCLTADGAVFAQLSPEDL